MSKIASKLQLGAAAGLMAAAATLLPLPAASAQPDESPGLGSSLGSFTCLFGIGDDCETTGTGGLFYLGSRDATPPTRSDFLVFHPVVPLSLIPVIGPPLAGWFATLDVEGCIGGLSGRIGPYGTVTASIGAGC